MKVGVRDIDGSCLRLVTEVCISLTKLWGLEVKDLGILAYLQHIICLYHFRVYHSAQERNGKTFYHSKWARTQSHHAVIWVVWPRVTPFNSPCVCSFSANQIKFQVAMPGETS